MFIWAFWKLGLFCIKWAICSALSTNVEGKLVKSELKCLKWAKVWFSMLVSSSLFIFHSSLVIGPAPISREPSSIGAGSALRYEILDAHIAYSVIHGYSPFTNHHFLLFGLLQKKQIFKMVPCLLHAGIRASVKTEGPHKCPDVRVWYENRLAFDRICRIKLLWAQQLNNFYFFQIWPVTMCACGRAFLPILTRH